MLAKRIIPCLDVKNGRVVKGVNFQGLQDVADPVEMARFIMKQARTNWFFMILPPRQKEELYLTTSFARWQVKFLFRLQ